MRLEIVDTPRSAREMIAHSKAARARLRSDAGIRKVPKLHPNIPVTKISWTFGGMTATGNVINFDFRPITLQRVIAAVCDFYNVSHNDLISACRDADVVYPRHVAMYLCRELTPRSFPMIGRVLGGRDHTTALYGWRKINALLETDERMADEIAILLKKLRP